ncbi:MAG: ABC transporter permease [Actinobacteria bacterium]|nr:ABC transporter permease [Actinomycetota bacterium]
MPALRNAATDISMLTKRNLLRYVRIPALLVFSSFQPIMFLLLFNYVFGGAIGAQSGGSYISFLLPGIVVQTVLFGTTATAVGLSEDFSRGMVDRFRSLPITRSAVLAGRTLADVCRNFLVVILINIVGYMLGFRYSGGLQHGLAALVLLLMFGFAFSWISAVIGMMVKDPETVQVAGFIWIFPLVFASGVFVPTQTMPSWLRVFAEHQPVTITVNALRSLLLEGTTTDVGKTLLWTGGILAVFVPLSVWAYKRIA